MKNILMTMLLFPLVLLGQSQDQNFTKTKVYRAPSTETIISTDTIVNVDYFDGLGRLQQSHL